MGLLTLFLVTLAAWGCQGGEESRKSTSTPDAVIDLALGPGEVVPIGPEQVKNRAFVRANFFDTSVTSAPHLLAGQRVLEFIPLVDSTREDVVIETRIVVDGEEETLDSHRAVPLRLATLRRQGGASLLGSRVRIDLSAYQGALVTLRWVPVGNEPGMAVGLGNVMIRRNDLSHRPDVLLICSDTHRFDHGLGPRGRRLMPTLEALATDAAVYEHSYSNASWTLPSVTSVLTGLYPRYHVTGEIADTLDAATYRPDEVPAGQFAFKTGSTYRLLTAYPPMLRTLPEYLRDWGYATVAVLSNPLYFLSGLALDGHDVAVDTGVVPGNEVNAVARWRTASAAPDKPLFLLVHYMDAHQWGPWYFEEAHPDMQKTDAPAEVRSSYARAVEDTDRHLSTLLDAWSAHRNFDQTLIFFFSDHGEHLVDGPREARLGHGNSMAEELLRVPLVVKFPGETRPGPRTDAVSLVDLLPTTLEATGIDAGAVFLSGNSLTAKDGTNRRPRTIFADYQLYGTQMSSIRKGTAKLVLDLQADGFSVDESRLLGLDGSPQPDAGPLQEALLQAYLDYSQTARRMTAGLERHEAIDQAEASRRLRALGYIR